ncbi:MAG: shikimate dehydrogenase [Bacteroidales bacterium]|nr:shikimate dehydrogenase [Bacteroidales bacterium]MBN2763321.1 shikimate dehydrogenase [Bacteroidales bacterium]
MRLFGLIGYPLSHSFSKKYFSEKFVQEKLNDCRYENFPMQSPDELPLLIADHSELEGLNVTIPHKEKILSFLNKLDENASAIGAVNTIKIIREKDKTILKGYNTDAYGFYASLKPLVGKKVKNALIIGTGGASKAVSYVLKNMGISCLFVSRHPRSGDHISYEELCGPVLYNFPLVVNTSPVGMYPDEEMCPDIPYEFITEKHLLYDLIYNPLETVFLKKGKEMGARTINGLKMLHLQAEKAWEIWNS